MPPVISVEVQEIRSAGILVTLADRQRLGLIRWRELSWDRSVDAILPIPTLGEKLNVVVLETRANAPYVELSVRRCSDPWQDLAQNFTEGQTVSGEVVNIRNFGVFVQLAPGIDAVIWPRALPLRVGEPIAALLAVGDKVQALIIEIDHQRQKIELSVNDWLTHLSTLALEKRISVQSAWLLRRQNPTLVAPEPAMATEHNTRYYPPIPAPAKVLVVDDNPADAQMMQHLLTQSFNFAVDCVHSGQAAVDRLAAAEQYGLALLDLHLQQEDGVQIADALLTLKPALAILFVTSDPTAAPTIAIDGRSMRVVFKNPAEIKEEVEQLFAGYWEPKQHKPAPPPINQGRFMQELGMTAFGRRPATEMVQQLLQTLQQETGVSQVLLLEVDTTNKAVAIQSSYPLLDEQVRHYSVDALYYSPVRNVVEDQDEFYYPHIDQERPAKFKNFFPLLVYQVCYGLPVTVPDHTPRHALFLLDEHLPEFDPQILEKAKLSVYLLQVALERAMLLEFMRRFEQRYTHGLLMSSLVHELSAKLDGLGGQTQRLDRLLASPTPSTASMAEALQKAQSVTTELTNAKQDMDELLYAYSRLAQNKLEAVEVNDVAQKVIRQLGTRAREAQVSLRLERAQPLPLAYTITSRLEQVITNLVLNGIQQIDWQARRMVNLADQQGTQRRLLQTGAVLVKMQWAKDNPIHPIQILVIDTGPGIHRHQQEEIFLLDTSNRRRGHGLGLFISRSLIETMGGRLQLLQSVMCVGSVFLVELPQAGLAK